MLDSHLLSRLDRLRLHPRRVHTGALRGERLSPRKGISIEFSDFRHYAVGDDVRHLDWNIYARLDRPVVRTYRDETELPVYLLTDASASMDFGSPPKWGLAKDLAVALGYIALSGGDALYPVVLTQSDNRWTGMRGKVAYRRLQDLLNDVHPDGKEVAESFRRFARAEVPRGMAFVLSDALDPEFPEVLRQVCGRGHEVVMLHLISDMELEPALEGDLKLLDAETGDPLEITASAGVLREYRRRFDAYCSQLDDQCRRLGVWILRIRSDMSVSEVLFRQLRRLGVVRFV